MAFSPATVNFNEYAWPVSSSTGCPRNLIFANAALDFLSDHHALFPRLAATLAPGGVFAAQMPSTARESSHALMRMVAVEGPWSSRLVPVAKTQPVIAQFEDYYAWLRPVASRIDMWMTTYVLMFDGLEEIADWFAVPRCSLSWSFSPTMSVAPFSAATATGFATPILRSRMAKSC